VHRAEVCQEGVRHFFPRNSLKYELFKISVAQGVCESGLVLGPLSQKRKHKKNVHKENLLRFMSGQSSGGEEFLQRRQDLKELGSQEDESKVETFKTYKIF
jgi:hypothetical protein